MSNHNKEIIEISDRILNGNLGVIEGARKLAMFHADTEFSDNKEILFFLLIDSESDHLPIGDERKQWSDVALLEKDKEISEFENHYRKQVMESCKSLISLLSA